MDFGSDLITQLFEHRLQQEDIKRVLGQLSDSARESFVDKIADVVSKLAALLEVANRVSDTLSLDTLLFRMVEIITDVTNSERSTIFLNDPETCELFSRVAQGDLTTEIRFPSHLGIAGEVFTTGRPVIIQDAYQDSRFNPEVDRQTGFRTRNILCAPVRTVDRGIVGVAQVLNKVGGDFNNEDLSMLEALASQAAAALLNAQLHEQVLKAKDEEAKLLEVTAFLSSELNLERLLMKIMDTTKDLLSADRCTLFMYDERDRTLWSRVAQGLETSEIRFPCHLGIAGSVFTCAETVNIPDAYNDRRFNPEVDKKTGYRTKSILCMPVINKKGQTLGVTQILNKKGGPFTPEDERRLRAFTAQASIAIENAMLFDDVLNMKNYNENMLESMSNGVISLDADRKIMKANAAALEILGASAGSLIDLDAAEFFSGPNQWVVESIGKVLATGQADLTMDTDLVVNEGRAVSVNLTTVPLIDIKKEPIGTLLLLEDITAEKRLKGTMARYMTKEVAERLLESGDTVLGGQAQEAAVLFSDIRSFTSISEKIGPQETVSLLNEYFTIMVDIIFNYQGILDKYIGDAIMAVFGAPLTTGEDSDRAVKAAVDMLRALREFNIRRFQDGKEPIKIGIGISTDEILSGNIGSLKRMDYTVIGDGVNLASRLEGANKLYGTQVLISEATYARLQGKFKTREVDRIRVKGKSKPVGILEVLDHHDGESFPNMGPVVECFMDGFELYKRRSWSLARQCFEKALALHEGDAVSRLYLDRCRYFEENEPPEGWDGVFVMKTK